VNKSGTKILKIVRFLEFLTNNFGFSGLLPNAIFQARNVSNAWPQIHWGSSASWIYETASGEGMRRGEGKGKVR